MTVSLVGSGPAREAVLAALGDVDTDVATVGPTDLSGQLGIVIGRTGEGVFQRANGASGDTPWLAVELGGIGSSPVVEAAVSGFAPETGCYDCLRTRVAANTDQSGAVSAPDAATSRFAGAIAGREASRLLAGEDSPLVGGVIEVPHAHRRVLPGPHCDCTPPADRRLERTVVDRDLAESLTLAEAALDERVGIVTEVGEAESFPLPYYLATVADTGGFSDVSAPSKAAGVDTDWNRAFMKALGEGLERYCASVYRTASFERGVPASVANPVEPSRFVLPADGDWPAPNDDTPLAWVPGTDLQTGEPVSLPAEFVHFPPPTERFRPAITTGLGLGNGTVEALLSGLYEAIERDAAMLSWYSTFEPLELAVDDERFQQGVRRARSMDLSVTPLLLTQDVDVPVVAVAVHREDWPRFAIAAAAHLDTTTAARSALTEAIQNWLELRGMGPEDAADENGAIGRYAEFPEPARAFVEPDQSIPADAVGPDTVPTGQAHLDAVLDRVHTAGLEACAARTTTTDVASLGFEAVRVLVPGAQPLFFDAPYFGDRVETVPRALGFEARLDREHHPFP